MSLWSRANYKFFQIEQKLRGLVRNQRVSDQPKFSFLLTVYIGTQANFLEELLNSLFVQTIRDFEVCVLVHGPVEDSVEALLRGLEKENAIFVFWEKENLGIMGGMSYLLGKARGEFLVPVDSDDLVEPKALEVFAKQIQTDSRLDYIFSDEDHLVKSAFVSPFYRKSWDPVWGTNTSYVWHLTCLRASAATEVGVYSNLESEYCHDWDTLIRFYAAGKKIAHVPKVLYHWRQHESSNTNTTAVIPEKVTNSQKAVLSHLVKTKGFQAEIVEATPFRGSPEFQINKLGISKEEVLVVSSATEAPEFLAGFKTVREWPSVDELKGYRYLVSAPGDLCAKFDFLPAVTAQLEIHSELSVLSGQVVDEREVVSSGCHFVNIETNEGKPLANFGPFGSYVKPRMAAKICESGINVIKVNQELVERLEPDSEVNLRVVAESVGKDGIGFHPILTAISKVQG